MDFTLFNSLNVFSVLIVLFILLILLKRNNSKNPLPPGLKGLPFLGNFELIKPKLFQTLAELGEKFGPVFHLKFLNQIFIIINSYDAVKEAYVKQGDVFSGRPQIFLFRWIHQQGGIAISEGELWKEHRQFSLLTFLKLGCGSSKVLNERLSEETRDIIAAIKTKTGNAFDPHLLLHQFTSNIIFSIICGKRLKYDNCNFSHLIENMDNMVSYLKVNNLVNFIPILRFFSTSFKKFVKDVKYTRQFLMDIINTHRTEFDPCQLNDYIDFYIKRMQEDKENNVVHSTFTVTQLIYSIEDLYIAGSDSPANTLRWFFLYMALYPDIQMKIHQEICDRIGFYEEFTLKDRKKLPYTEAAILETQRYANLIPVGAPHKTLKETLLYGYYIPKGAMVLTNCASFHHNPNLWVNPNVFNPERFINEQNFLKTNIEYHLPFSIGKRSCIGESIAKLELLYFIVSILQKFSINLPEDSDPLNEKDCIEGPVLSPLPYKISFVEYENKKLF